MLKWEQQAQRRKIDCGGGGDFSSRCAEPCIVNYRKDFRKYVRKF
jgi:hypothetical protein